MVLTCNKLPDVHRMMVVHGEGCELLNLNQNLLKILNDKPNQFAIDYEPSKLKLWAPTFMSI